MIGLIVTIVGTAVSGCHSASGKVVCDLDPPAPAPANRAAPPVAKPILPIRTADSRVVKPVVIRTALHGARSAAASVKTPTKAPPAALTVDEVQHRLTSLVSIGDCTGARDYARLIGAANLADKTFAACVGQHEAPRLSYAIDGWVPAVTPNDAIIDQIPDAQ